MNIVELIETITILGVVCGLGIVGFIQWIKHLSEEERKGMSGEPINSRMIKDMWVCKECGSFNSPYNKRCGKCFNIKSDKNEK